MKKAFLLIFFCLLLVKGVEAACTTPVANLVVNVSTTLCSGTYYINMSNNSVDYGVIRLTTSSVTLDCNNSIIIGNKTGFGIVRDSGFAKNLIVVKNCNFQRYYKAYHVVKVSNFSFYNNSGYNTTRDVMYLGNMEGAIIENNTFDYATDTTYGSGLYLDALVTTPLTSKNVIVRNNVFKNLGATGLHINSNNKSYVNNVSAYNNVFYSNGGYALNNYACSNCLFYNNVIYNTSSTTDGFLRLGYDRTGDPIGAYAAINNSIYNNTVYGMGSGNVATYFIDYYTSGNNIYNNSYDNNSQKISIRLNESKTRYYTLYENTTKNILLRDLNGYNRITLNYSGLKVLSNNNATYNISLISPYTDVYNVTASVIIYSGAGNYVQQLILNENSVNYEDILVGEYSPSSSTCYPGLNNTFWSIPMESNCTISIPFTGNITLTGSGKVYINSTVNTSNSWVPNGSQIRYFLSNARVY